MRITNQKKIDDAGYQYIRERYMFMTYQEMADALGVTDNQVRHAIKTLGLRKGSWGNVKHRALIKTYRDELIYVRRALKREDNETLQPIIDHINETLAHKK